MPVSEMSAIERIARVLAGQRLSINAEGRETSAGDLVDSRWSDFRDDAIAVLRTLREPDPGMASSGDAETWRRMVDTALGDHRAAASARPGDAARGRAGGPLPTMPEPAEGSDDLPPRYPGSPSG